MDRKWHYYLVVNANDMYTINYTMLEENINDEKKGLLSYTGSNCQEIFEKNEIPSNMQKMFISINILKNILCKEEIGKEYLTNIPIRIFKNRYDDYSTNGEMIGNVDCSKLIGYYNFLTTERNLREVDKIRLKELKSTLNIHNMV